MADVPEPIIPVPIETAIDAVKWAAGMLAAGALGWNRMLHTRLGRMDTRLAEVAKVAEHAKNNRAQIELGVMERYATKADVADAVVRVEHRIDQLRDDARTGRAEVMDKLNQLSERRASQRGE